MALLKYTIKKFAKDVIKLVRVHQPDSNPVYIEADSMIQIPKTGEGDRADMKIHLSGLYRQWKDLPRKERLSNIDSLLESILHPSVRSVDDRLASLRLRARAIEELRNRQLSLNTHGMSPVVYGDGLIVLELVEDSESTVSLVAEESLDSLQISSAQAFKMAAAAMFRETAGDQWKAVGKLWYSTYNDDYDFARMLAAGSDSRLPFSNGRCIAYAPSHAVCLVCNAEDANLLSQMINIGDEMCGNQRVLSKKLWTLNFSGQWVLYKNDSDAQIARIVKTQEIIENSDNYAQQKSCLEKIHEANLEDTFVASYVGVQNEEGEVISMCTYTVNLPSLLPVTDMVNIYEHESDRVLCAISWQEFEKIAGASLKKCEQYIPARYELANALSVEQIELFKHQKSIGE